MRDNHWFDVPMPGETVHSLGFEFMRDEEVRDWRLAHCLLRWNGTKWNAGYEIRGKRPF